MRGIDALPTQVRVLSLNQNKYKLESLSICWQINNKACEQGLIDCPLILVFLTTSMAESGAYGNNSYNWCITCQVSNYLSKYTDVVFNKN